MRIYGDTPDELRRMTFTWLLGSIGEYTQGETKRHFCVALTAARLPSGGVQLDVEARAPTQPEAVAAARKDLYDRDWPDPDHPSLNAGFGAFCPDDGSRVTVAVLTQRGLEEVGTRLREDPPWPPPQPPLPPDPTSPEGIQARLQLLNQGRWLAYQVHWMLNEQRHPPGSPERIEQAKQILATARRLRGWLE